MRATPLLAFALTAGLLASSGAGAQHDHQAHDHAGHASGDVQMYDPAVQAPDFRRTQRHYAVPDVTLYDQAGAPVALAQLLNEPRPTALQFIFTSCATICPVLTAVMAQAQEPMREAAPATRLISISIDPEYDTPERLAAYANRFGAEADWLFLTGSREDVRSVLVTFDALYRSDNKMYHQPYTYLRRDPEAPWLRLGGLISEADLVEQFATVLSGDRAASAASR